MTNEIAVEEVANKATAMLGEANAFSIVDNQSYTNADQRCVALMALKKEIVSTFELPKKRAVEAHKAILAAESMHLEPVEQARVIYKSKMSVWAQEQELARQAEEKRLQDQARRLEEDRRLAEASLAEQAGDKAEAQAVLDLPIEVPTIVLPKAMPKTATVIRKIKKFRVKDILEVKPVYLMPNEVLIGQIVRAHGKAAEMIVGGIEVYEETC